MRMFCHGKLEKVMESHGFLKVQKSTIPEWLFLYGLPDLSFVEAWWCGGKHIEK